MVVHTCTPVCTLLAGIVNTTIRECPARIETVSFIVAKTQRNRHFLMQKGGITAIARAEITALYERLSEDSRESARNKSCDSSFSGLLQ